MFCNAKIEEVESFSLSRHGGDMQLSDNFILREFACKDGSDEVKVHPNLVVMLQMIRDHFGAPVSISSAYRTESHNAKIGGAKNSAHKKGMAADIRVKGVKPAEVAEYADYLGAGGIGRYHTFTHVDVWGAMRRWKG